MHISRKHGEQVEVNWAGDPAEMIDPDTGAVTEAYLFGGVMTYNQYAYVKIFINGKQIVLCKYDDSLKNCYALSFVFCRLKYRSLAPET